MTAGRHPGEPLSVLVIDDPDTADSMATVLRHSGHRAVAVTDEADALAAAAADPPDVVLVEPWLGEAAGFRVAHALRAPAGRVPPLLLTLGSLMSVADRLCIALRSLQITAPGPTPTLATRGSIVALTGYGTAADRDRTAAAGFHLHLLKPADPAVVVGVVARFGRVVAYPG